MSNVPSQQQWVDHHHQFYQTLPLQDQEQSISSDRFSSTFTDPTMVTTTTIADDGVGHLNPERRVTKPTRRRSRVSKKTHNVTMVNTDIANFRSMVQQFTGGTISEVVFPFAPQISNTATNLNASQFPMNSSNSAGYQQFQNQQQQLQQQQEQYRYSLYR